MLNGTTAGARTSKRDGAASWEAGAGAGCVGAAAARSASFLAWSAWYWRSQPSSAGFVAAGAAFWACSAASTCVATSFAAATSWAWRRASSSASKRAVSSRLKASASRSAWATASSSSASTAASAAVGSAGAAFATEKGGRSGSVACKCVAWHLNKVTIFWDPSPASIATRSGVRPSTVVARSSAPWNKSHRHNLSEPPSAAWWSGVPPCKSGWLRASFREVFAFVVSQRATSKWPLKHAVCSGKAPCASAVVTSNPWSAHQAAISRWPPKHAMCKGVAPMASRARVASAPWRTACASASSLPSRQAWRRALSTWEIWARSILPSWWIDRLRRPAAFLAP